MLQAWLCPQRMCQAAGNRVTRGARTHPSSSRGGMEHCACLPSGAVGWKRCAAVSWHCRSHTCISVMETCLSIAQSVRFNSFNKIIACAVVLLQATAAAFIADARHACVFFLSGWMPTKLILAPLLPFASVNAAGVNTGARHARLLLLGGHPCWRTVRVWPSFCCQPHP